MIFGRHQIDITQFVTFKQMYQNYNKICCCTFSSPLKMTKVKLEIQNLPEDMRRELNFTTKLNKFATKQKKKHESSI